MKISFYNTIITVGDYFLCFNAFNNSFLLLNKEQYQLFDINKNSVDSLEKIDSVFYNNLSKNGFIVNDNIDEPKLHLYHRIQRKYSTNIYHIILNPTLNCNLSCWYCFENHIENSTISDTLLKSLQENINNKYNDEPFRYFILNFFGGEPLLYTRIVIDIVSFCKEFCKQNNICFSVGFVTNGTVITKDFLNNLKDCNSSFQVSMDGARHDHNIIKYHKSSKNGTYDLVLKNIRRIQDTLKDVKIAIRINYNEQTLKNIDKFMFDLRFLDKKKCSFSLHKVWQVNNNSIEPDDIINALETILGYGFIVDFSPLEYNTFRCYADNMNQLVMNYDGNIFKCTAHDFTENNASGKILADGTVKWNYWKVIDSVMHDLPERCLNCKLLPVCNGPCSNSLATGENSCFLDSLKISFDDYMIYNFKRAILFEKINELSNISTNEK
jgi:uncharacterized protein